MTTKQAPRKTTRKRTETKTETIQVRLSAAEAQSLRLKAKEEDRPVSNFVRKVLRQAVGSLAA